MKKFIALILGVSSVVGSMSCVYADTTITQVDSFTVGGSYVGTVYDQSDSSIKARGKNVTVNRVREFAADDSVLDTVVITGDREIDVKAGKNAEINTGDFVTATGSCIGTIVKDTKDKVKAWTKH